MMHQVNGEWLIYDMQIDDVSLVLNYRSQFNHFLNKSSYAALMQTMRSRLQQLTAS
jgi:phospholipid transport system substrate-binding protein